MKNNDFWKAFLIFNLSVIIIIGLNAVIMGVGVRFDFTISRYVGLNLVTAGLFLISNVFVARYMYLGFLKLKKKLKLSNVWWLLGVIMISALILLSCCPVGYFDKFVEPYGTSVVSEIHLLAAKSMFVLAIVTGVEVLIKVWGNLRLRFLVLGFMVYAIIYVLLYNAGNEVFGSCILFFEWGFLGYFIAMMGEILGKVNNKK